jgi:hypothetical protein
MVLTPKKHGRTQDDSDSSSDDETPTHKMKLDSSIGREILEEATLLDRSQHDPERVAIVERILERPWPIHVHLDLTPTDTDYDIRRGREMLLCEVRKLDRWIQRLDQARKLAELRPRLEKAKQMLAEVTEIKLAQEKLIQDIQAQMHELERA